MTIWFSYSVLRTFSKSTNRQLYFSGRRVPPSTICRSLHPRTGWAYRFQRKAALSISHNLTLDIKNQTVDPDVCLVTFTHLTYNSYIYLSNKSLLYHNIWYLILIIPDDRCMLYILLSRQSITLLFCVKC